MPGKKRTDYAALKARLFNETDYAVVRTYVSQLPSPKREILEQHFWEGLSLTEIAAVLGISWADINREIKDAFAFLKACCEKDPRFSRKKGRENRKQTPSIIAS